MIRNTRCFRWAVLAALVVAAAAPAMAAPSIEAMKAESGLRFSEDAGWGHARPETPAVWAGGERGRRANLAVETRARARKPQAPEPPAPSVSPAPPAPAPSEGISVGRKILMGAGNIVGAGLTVAVVAAFGPGVLGLMGVAGAVAAGRQAYNRGDRGWALVKKAAVGAVAGVASIALVGMAIGDGTGRVLERLFKR